VSVYVDDMRAGFGRMVMCHMIADTNDELLTMADKIGVSSKWLQHPGTPGEHFDIALSRRAIAVELGAVQITQRQCAAMTGLRRRKLPMGDPATAVERYLAARASAGQA
jgi:hypothetical protein